MDLFGYASDTDQSQSPLAEALRPKTLDEVLGQPKILGQNTPWKRLILTGQVPSLILWGPPGTGKTTLANLIAKQIDAEIISVNAIESGAKALREIGESARYRRMERQRRTVLFVDEIHRLNRAQQDVLLPFVEKGDILLIGATTENPSYELNAALLSRCRLLVFDRLSNAELKVLFEKACAHYEANPENVISAEALDEVANLADGDARRLLNMAEVLLKLFNENKAQGANAKQSQAVSWPIDKQSLTTLLDLPALRYDKSSDEHYDTISAFIKSIRGSDPNAGLYYLARMIKGGEDPVFIARRLVILASEDIGNADPRAITLAVSGLQAVELVGWPEAAISLAQVVTYLASAPKSNRSYLGLKAAQECVDQTGTVPIPLALRSAKTSSMKNLGYGKDYQYSHDSEKGYIEQKFLPDQLGDEVFYEPSEHGFEKTYASI